MNFKMPDMIFDGATFRISPRAIEGNGIVAKLEYIPNTDATEVEARGEDLSRFFKKKISKSLNYFRIYSHGYRKKLLLVVDS